MNRLLTRLERLEAASAPSGILFLTREEGENGEACIRRHGYDPALARASFVIIDHNDPRMQGL